MDLKSLLIKYPGPYPRYNYYPRIGSWMDNLNSLEWQSELERYENKEIDLYIHIPFCQSMCSFCGCNAKKLNESKEVENYISALIEEMKFSKVNNKIIKNVYIGGGSPNTLNKDQYERIFQELDLKNLNNFHMEVDLRYYQRDLFEYLFDKGLNYLSFGLQDDSEKTLHSISRKTNLNDIKAHLEQIKRHREVYINMDLIYGLAHQHKSTPFITKLIKDNLIDSISLYPFAEVPWYKDFYPLWNEYKPSLEKKYEIFMSRLELFENFEFFHIGYGHFYKKDHPVYKAFENNNLRRTIMGYTESKSELLIGLGVSAISESPQMMKQGEKTFDNYVYNPINIANGHKKSGLEITKTQIIENISSQKDMEKLPALLTKNLPNELVSNKEGFKISKNGRALLSLITKEILSGITES